jgi:hypothetical protein
MHAFQLLAIVTSELITVEKIQHLAITAREIITQEHKSIIFSLNMYNTETKKE